MRACLEILRPGGRMAFYTIHAAEGLSAAEQEKVEGVGLFALGEDGEAPQDQLRSAGFVGIERHDLTVSYRETLLEILLLEESFAPSMRQDEGSEAFDQRLARRQAKLEAIDAGLLRRSLFLAEAPRTN